jgi:ABC-type dipeptide/oligopeptide/nickel transport system permease component/ABC-type transport system substrate-binding protein
LRKILIYFLGLFGASVLFILLVLLSAFVVSPHGKTIESKYDPNVIADVRESRKIIIDINNPPVFYRQVNYSEGKKAKWYPKNQSPILKKLEQEGLLEPVEKRVGPEPLVVQGVEGVGKYGGTWHRLTTDGSMAEMGHRLSYVTLVRWSSQGYPIVPHLAKSYEISEDNCQFTFHLRKGVRWSDGHPFTADDIMFWWKYVANDKSVMPSVPEIMKVRGQPGTIEKIDDYTVRFTFPFPNGVFLAKLASDASVDNMVNSPAHYLSKYHPSIGNRDLINQMLRASRIQSDTALFRNILNSILSYPDKPALWPWIYRRYKADPPQSFVRNPYYWMVDTEGNQLPYIDRIVFEQKSPGMIPIAAANGEVSMQLRFIPYEEYTHLMSQQQQGDYTIYHWYPGDRSVFVITPNLNYKIETGKAETSYKHQLLNDKRFRQALSLAIDRKKLIDAEYSGQTEPAQCAPGPSSFFYHEGLYRSFTDYDPKRATDLLDEIGLVKKDFEGYRTFPDGSRMTFYLNVASGFSSTGMAQLVCDCWADIGLRVIPRIRNSGLFYTEKMALRHDLDVWVGNSEFVPVMEPRYFVPVTSASNFAIGYSKWYLMGGLYNNPAAASTGCIEPPYGHPCREVMELYDLACAFSDRDKQKEVFDKIFNINQDNLWTINISTPPPAVVVVKNGFRNVPKSAVACWMFRTPGNAGMETYFFDKPSDPPSVIEEIKDSMVHIKMPDRLSSISKSNTGEIKSPSGKLVVRIIEYLFWAVFLLLILLVIVRHPYAGKRFLIMIPTLLVVSIVIFTIIQLPPGDYLTTRMMMLAEQGDSSSLQELADLKKMFWLDEPMHIRYIQWMGLPWFISFNSSDTGLLQGNLGRSMQAGQPVNDIVGDRIILTVFLSLGTILFTWAVAMPVGIYSAVRQYSIGDYVLTFLGFIGMCIPSFLLALIIMYLGKRYLGISFSGLFSSRYGAQAQWDWFKFLDLLKHIWLPIFVIGLEGTAGMIRVMRGNLLDELRKPYVVTARAKGVRPVKLLLKYPVRLALNPFVSGMGALFPNLVSGGAIVAMVLSLPTVGPLMLDALMTEDMYLAGSMLMVLSLLGVIGTLVSDLLLLWLDPRIRFTGETR